MTPARRAVCRLLPLALLVATGPLGADPAPEVTIVAPPGLEDVATEVSDLTDGDFTHLLLLTGLMGFTRPVTVVLVPESSPVAAETPKWVAGYSRGDRATIVLFPARVPSYPDRTLDSLFRHELAHVLVWEAAGGRAPRWLDEGIATVAAREWGLEDRARFAVAVVGRGPKSVRQVDRAFRGSAGEVARAYALSSGFVRFLQAEYGSFAPAGVLHELARGRTLDDAFRSATGASLDRAEARFFKEESFWNLWVPFVSSPQSLWMLVTLLAIFAVGKRLIQRRLAPLEDEPDETAAEDLYDDRPI